MKADDTSTITVEFCLGDMVCVKFLLVFLGKEFMLLGFRHTCRRKAIPLECRGVGLGINRLDSQYGCCAIYYSWFMLRGRGRKWITSQLLCSQRGISVHATLREATPE